MEVQYFVKGGEIVVPGRKVLHKYDEPVAVDMYIRQVRTGEPEGPSIWVFGCLGAEVPEDYDPISSPPCQDPKP